MTTGHQGEARLRANACLASQTVRSERKAQLGTTVAHTMRTRDRWLYGVLAPIGTMIAGLFVVSLTDTRAGAAEFAALGIMLGGLIAMPFVLLINLVTLFQAAHSPMACFARGMIAPGIVLIGAIFYQMGVWDAGIVIR